MVFQADTRVWGGQLLGADIRRCASV